jgi:hypothetical protein
MVAAASPLSMTDGQREVLETLLRSHIAPVRQVRRAQARWTATAEQILEKVKRARTTLETLPS